VQADQAAVESARVNLAYTRITAPIGGTIATSTYTVGALVTANQTTALTTIYRYDTVYVDITQSSAQYLQLRKDLASGRLKADASGAAKFKLILEDGSTYQREGSLHFVGVAVDESTGTITLRGTVANPDKLLLPNMYVHADLEQGVDNNALWVPQQGVSHDAKGDATALVVGSDNKVVQKSLTVAGAVGGDWIVDSGLKAGDRVIVAGLQNVKEGDTVDPQEAGAASAAPTSVGQPATPKS
jgi:RND family efflux transporter MFP subunit